MKKYADLSLLADIQQYRRFGPFEDPLSVEGAILFVRLTSDFFAIGLEGLA